LQQQQPFSQHGPGQQSSTWNDISQLRNVMTNSFFPFAIQIFANGGNTELV